MTGRFAPSPSGDLHLGNLRTALAAWLSARHRRERFIVRVEDLDPSIAGGEHEQRQLADLATLGIDWDGDVMRQSERLDRYGEVIDELAAAGVTYECYCSRRDIREASQAPHASSKGAEGVAAPHGAYPGTCRSLTDDERAERAAARPAAVRISAGAATRTVDDVVAGATTCWVDDFVLCRNDGVPAYHVAVVVDDAEQGVTEVVRGDDLLSTAARHVHLQQLLGLPTPTYAHVPLVVGSDGFRLAKRDGAVTLSDLAQVGVDPPRVLGALGVSLGLSSPGEVVTAGVLLDRFDGGRTLRVLGRKPVSLSDLEQWL